MKKAILISILVVFFATSAAIYAGCGGSTSSATSDPQKVFDDAMHEAIKGNFQLFTNMIPADLRDAYAQGIEQSFPYTNANIEEIHYRTDTIDADHVTVYFWGVFDMPSGDQQTITEDQAQGIPLAKQDGQWYFDLGSTTSQEQTPSQ
jgi:hypothetical protein